MTVKIKFTTGKEVELNEVELKELNDMYREHKEEVVSLPYNPPMYPSYPYWPSHPYYVSPVWTCSSNKD
jgi:hypothetical protein